MTAQKDLKLRHHRYKHVPTSLAALENFCHKNQKVDAKDKVSYIEGTIFSAEEMYVTTRQFVSELPYHSRYDFMQIYYQSIRSKAEDFLTTHDYIWR